MATSILIATASFSTEIDGTPMSISKGETFHESSPRYARLPTEVQRANFEPFTVDNDIEQATAAPGEKRSTKVRRKSAKVEPEPVVEAPAPEPAPEQTEDTGSERTAPEPEVPESGITEKAE
jgi:hypothetical protein